MDVFDLVGARTYILVNGTAPAMATQQAVIFKEIFIMENWLPGMRLSVHEEQKMKYRGHRIERALLLKYAIDFMNLHSELQCSRNKNLSIGHGIIEIKSSVEKRCSMFPILLGLEPLRCRQLLQGRLRPRRLSRHQE